MAVAALDAPGSWPLGKLALIGPPGSGKTHLAHVFAAATGAHIVSAEGLATAHLADLAGGPVVLEDADRARQRDEAAVFHLHNLLAEARAPFLLTARIPPSHWQTQLADLASRLRAASVVRLAPPDDALLAQVLVKLFADRQLVPSPPLIAFLVARIDRSFAAAADIVDRLDAAALAEGRPVTRRLAQHVLDKPGPAGP